MENDLVTIAIHTGKKDYYPLVENFLKSLLQCVMYPKIEIMLIESAGHEDIRKWFDNIDFDDYFVNFLGSKSNIKKNKGVEIIKTVKYYDFPDEYAWFECYTHSIQRAIDECKGKYFSFFAEDSQFTIKGNIISDYIKIMEKENNFKSFVHFFAQQKYKLYKENNYFDKKSSKVLNIEYFKPKHKWDFWSLTLTENYKNIGRLVMSTTEKPHNTVSDYSQRTKEQDYVRIYPKLPHGVWFHNNDRPKIIRKILKNDNDPDYVYHKILDKDFMLAAIENYEMPVSTDDYEAQVN